VLVLCATVSAQEYTQDALRARLEGESEPLAVGKICGEFMMHATDMDVIRLAQDNWRRADAASARSYAETMAHRFPDSAKFLYLFGRLLDSPVKQIEVGRRVIGMAPYWPYGYRLVAGNYLSDLFTSKESGESQKKLSEMLPADEQVFHRLVDLVPDQDFPLFLLFNLQLYRGQFDSALVTLSRAMPMNVRWATLQSKGELLARMGRYDDAYRALDSALGPLVENGMPPEEHDRTLVRMYQVVLVSAGAYPQLIEFLKSRPGYGEDPEILYNLGCAYAQSGNPDQAFVELGQAARMGFDAARHIERDSDLAPLKGDARWAAFVAQVKENWDRGAPARKAAVLKTKFSRPAPEFSLPDEEGRTIRLSDMRGKVVVLDFWATWCGPCRISMPIINEFVRGRKSPGVEVFSIDVWETDRDRAKAYMAENGYAMRLLFGNDDVVSAYEFEGIPYLCVIDREGMIRYEERGLTESLDENLVWWTEDLL
jgi:thiol-disulfide isomerase/thioredoxin